MGHFLKYGTVFLVPMWSILSSNQEVNQLRSNKQMKL